MKLTKEQQELLLKLEEQAERRRLYHKAYNARKTPEQKARDAEYHKNYNRNRRELLLYLRSLSESES